MPRPRPGTEPARLREGRAWFSRRTRCRKFRPPGRADSRRSRKLCRGRPSRRGSPAPFARSRPRPIASTRLGRTAFQSPPPPPPPPSTFRKSCSSTSLRFSAGRSRAPASEQAACRLERGETVAVSAAGPSRTGESIRRLGRGRLVEKLRHVGLVVPLHVGRGGRKPTAPVEHPAVDRQLHVDILDLLVAFQIRAGPRELQNPIVRPGRQSMAV